MTHVQFARSLKALGLTGQEATAMTRRVWEWRSVAFSRPMPQGLLVESAFA